MTRKVIALLVLALVSGVLTLPVRAQDFTFSGSSTIRDGSPIYGSDAWFALPQNYHDQNGKYFQLYVASPENTIVHVDLPSGPKSVNITAYQVASIGMPLGNEMKTSSVVEAKGIRVWSANAPLVSYVMSHNPYTSDGFYVIPTIGLGRDYVVAAYQSLFEGFGTYVYDFPSEFTVTAPYNNTTLTERPVQDIRGRDSNTIAFHPKDVVFHEFLQHGQAVQYQLVQAQDAMSYDVTGTTIHASNPVSVYGASQCPNIPPDFPYCDHICDGIPPIRDWGKLYYTTNFFQTDQGHDASTVLVIGTQRNQVIRRYDAEVGLRLFCTLAAPFDHYFNPDVSKSSRFESDYPFMLVQYVNSSTYPNGANGNGDPAMCVIPAADNMWTEETFQTPSSIGAQSPYINYVNVLVRNGSSTTFDGKDIASYTRQMVDSNYSVYRLSNIRPGAHTVKSTSGIAVYIYGYSFDETYAWPGATTILPKNVDDSLPPSFSHKEIAHCVHVIAQDSGSGLLTAIHLDSLYNMSFVADSNAIDGDSTRSTYADLCIIDSTYESAAAVSIMDMAGNRSTLQIHHDRIPLAPRAGFRLSQSDFDSVYVGDTSSQIVIVVSDTSKLPITVTSITSSGPEFTFDTSRPASNALPHTMLPGDSQAYVLSFAPLHPGTRATSVRVTIMEAPSQLALVTGFGVLKAGVSRDSWMNDENGLNSWLRAGDGELSILSPAPNPSSGGIVLTYALRQEADLSIEVYSILGERVLQTTLPDRSSGISQTSLDLHHLPAGSYVLRAAAFGEVHSAKLTISK